MATLKYSPELRSKIRKTLRLLSKDLIGSGIALRDSDLSQEYLNLHGIERHTDLSWRQVEDPECHSSFGMPLDSDSIDAIFKDAFTEHKPEWPPHDLALIGHFNSAYHQAYALLEYSDSINWELATSPWERMERGKRRPPLYSSFYNEFTTEWRAIEVFQTVDNQKPHLATLMIDGASANPELRRSELFSAVYLILWSMKLDKCHEYATNPVFVYSISHYALRILQVHYDRLKQKLVVRTTPYIDLTEERDDIIKLCVQWMLNTPTGETRFPAANGRGETSSNEARLLGLSSARKSPISKTSLEKGRSPRNRQVTKLSEPLK